MQFGIIFDWDGVVIDSSSMHERSWEILASEEKRSLPADHFKMGFGRKNQYIIPSILNWSQDSHEIQRLADRKEWLYRQIVKEEGLDPLPGVRALLEAIHSAEIPCAIGSSTPRENLDAVIEGLGLPNCFQFLVSGDDVGKGKPDPEVFLKAAKGIACEPHSCIVFEDAFYGLEAARAAGMKTVAVATTNPLNDLKGSCDWAVESLEEVTLRSLKNLF